MLQKAIEKAQQEIERIRLSIELAQTLPESDLPIKVGIADTTVHIDLPFNWDIFREYRHLLGRDWESSGEWVTTQLNDNSIHYHMTFKHKRQKEVYPQLMIALDSDSDRSVCQVKQVGVKEVPVMEVVCN